MTLQELNNKFIYTRDIDQYGFDEVWTGLIEVDGHYFGDCEDYAITVKREIDGFKDWKYCSCKLNGEGHCILVSPNGKDMIDNNMQRVMSVYSFTAIYRVTDIRAMNIFELAWKFTQGWFIKKMKGL